MRQPPQGKQWIQERPCRSTSLVDLRPLGLSIHFVICESRRNACGKVFSEHTSSTGATIASNSSLSRLLLLTLLRIVVALSFSNSKQSRNHRVGANQRLCGWEEQTEWRYQSWYTVIFDSPSPNGTWSHPNTHSHSVGGRSPSPHATFQPGRIDFERVQKALWPFYRATLSCQADWDRSCSKSSPGVLAGEKVSAWKCCFQAKHGGCHWYQSPPASKSVPTVSMLQFFYCLALYNSFRVWRYFCFVSGGQKEQFCRWPCIQLIKSPTSPPFLAWKYRPPRIWLSPM